MHCILLMCFELIFKPNEIQDSNVANVSTFLQKGNEEFPQNFEKNKTQLNRISDMSKLVGFGILFSIKELTDPSLGGSQKLLATTLNNTKTTNNELISKISFFLSIKFLKGKISKLYIFNNSHNTDAKFY